MRAPRWIREPRLASRIHAAAAGVFLVQIPVAVLTPLKDSVPYLVFLSLWALVGAHWSAYQAAQSEEASEDDDEG
jgi:hypothetical protein